MHTCVKVILLLRQRAKSRHLMKFCKKIKTHKPLHNGHVQCTENLLKRKEGIQLTFSRDWVIFSVLWAICSQYAEDVIYQIMPFHTTAPCQMQGCH